MAYLGDLFGGWFAAPANAQEAPSLNTITGRMQQIERRLNDLNSRAGRMTTPEWEETQRLQSEFIDLGRQKRDAEIAARFRPPQQPATVEDAVHGTQPGAPLGFAQPPRPTQDLGTPTVLQAESQPAVPAASPSQPPAATATPIDPAEIGRAATNLPPSLARAVSRAGAVMNADPFNAAGVQGAPGAMSGPAVAPPEPAAQPPAAPGLPTGEGGFGGIIGSQGDLAGINTHPTYPPMTMPPASILGGAPDWRKIMGGSSDPWANPTSAYAAPPSAPPAWNSGAKAVTAPDVMPGAAPMQSALAPPLPPPADVPSRPLPESVPMSAEAERRALGFPGLSKPAAASPTASPEKTAPSGSLLDRIGKGFSNLGDFINAHPLTLMALGAGMANSQNWGQAIHGGLSAAVPAMQADQKTQIQLQSISQTYKALVARGIPAQDALAAVYNPDVMKAVVSKYFEGQIPKWGVVYKDKFGQEHYGFIDSNKEQVTMANTPHVKSFEEALRLQPGTQFVDPSGTLRVR
jgi:hypothetical protein